MEVAATRRTPVRPGHGTPVDRFRAAPPGRLSSGVAAPLGSAALPRGVAQLGSARRSGRRGRRFKSCHPDSRIGPLTCRDAGQGPSSCSIRATCVQQRPRRVCRIAACTPRRLARRSAPRLHWTDQYRPERPPGICGSRWGCLQATSVEPHDGQRPDGDRVSAGRAISLCLNPGHARRGSASSPCGGSCFCSSCPRWASSSSSSTSLSIGTLREQSLAAGRPPERPVMPR